jgi:hypothetical protein
MNASRLLLGVLAILTIGLAGCSNDDDAPPTGPVGTNSTTRDATGKFWVTRVDATSDNDFAYYSFAQKDLVALTAQQAQSSTTWDLAFQRSVIITNSGQSGPGDVEGVDLNALGDATPFTSVSAANISSIPKSSWQTDGEKLVIDDYYTYDPQTHTMDLTQYVYAMMDASGHYVKFQFLELLGGGAPPAMGNFVIKYVHQSEAGNADLSGPARVDTVDGSSGMFYYDFSSGAAVNPADPANSLDWDIKVSSYNVYLNSSFSGAGNAAANPVYALFDNMADWTDFEFYTEAVAVPQAYAQDELGSVFTNWYDYNGQTHTLASKGHTYVLKVGEKSYKLRIDTYYGDTGQSGNIIWHWEEL